MSLLRRAARRAMRMSKAGALVDAYRKGVLVEEDWFRSFKTLESVGPGGVPLPWYTYAFIHFLEPRLRDDLRVFEYGSGNSTRWYSQRVKEVIAVEHDPAWAGKIAALLPASSKVVLRTPGDAYVNEISGRGPFDIVVIDGIEELRPACARAALAELAPHGVFVWDNSDREEFERGMELLRGEGFRSLGFKGLGPTAITGWETAVVYRSDNHLGI